MAKKYFEIFQQPSDFLNWAKHIEFVSVYPYVSVEIQEQWIDALKYLQIELGKGFLKTSGKNHLFYNEIINKEPWRIKSLIQTVAILRILKGSNDNTYHGLLKKMKSREKCRREFMPFIEIAKMYYAVGLHVRFPIEIMGQTNPDIEIVHPNTNDKLFIEVSKLNDGEERERNDKNYDQLHHELMSHCFWLPFSCTQFDYIIEDEMTIILSKIREAKEIVLQRELVIYKSNKIEIAIAHPSDNDKLEKWCELNKRRKGQYGVPIDFNETIRIHRNNKIKDEARQLPENYTGLIYIPVHPLYFLGVDIEEAILVFEKQMNLYPNLFGVVLFSTVCDNISPISWSENGHVYSSRMINESVARDLLFIRNHKYISSMATETEKKIYNSFT